MIPYADIDISRVTTVIFDMDGTLIKHTWQLSEITGTLFARFASALTPVTHDEFFDLFWRKNEDLWYMMVDGVIDGDTAARYSYVNTLRALRQDTTLADAMLDTWRELILAEAVPFEDTFSVLEKVGERYTTGIVTNGFTTLQRSKISRHNLAGYVDFTLVSEEAGAHKPDRQIFLKALELAGNILPEQAIYVGDNPAADIEGALAAGLVPVLMDPEDNLEPPAGVAKIKQLSEILALLQI